MNNLGFGLTALAFLVGCEQEDSNTETDFSEAGVEELRDALEKTTLLLEKTKEALDIAQDDIAEIQADYVKSNELEEFATEEWIQEQDFADDKDIEEAMQSVATQEWVMEQEFADSTDIEKTAQSINDIKSNYVTSSEMGDINNMMNELETNIASNKTKIMTVESDYVTSGQIADMASAATLNNLTQKASDNTDQINEIKSDYLKAADIQDMPTAAEFEALATMEWVNQQSFADASELIPIQDDLTQVKANYVQQSSMDAYVTEEDLSDYASTAYVTDQISVVQTDVATIQADYLTSSDLSGVPNSGDYVTTTWVAEQNFLTSSDVSNFATSTALDALSTQVAENNTQLTDTNAAVDLINADYVKSADISDFVTSSWVNGQNFSTQGVADLSNYLSVDTTSNTVTFSGANIYVQNGAGATDSAPNGLGNIIVGYDENNDVIANGAANEKSGSHNLILGMYHNYKGYGGIVSGKLNTIENAHAIAFGENNISRGKFSSVLGGKDNEAFADGSAIIGGESNIASGDFSSVSGGQYNEASGLYSSVSGGANNIAEGNFSTVAGGDSITISDEKGTNP